jgi:hypothetical protein
MGVVLLLLLLLLAKDDDDVEDSKSITRAQKRRMMIRSEPVRLGNTKKWLPVATYNSDNTPGLAM